MKKKTTTIDSLAVMVAKGFSSVDKRFDDIDKKFTDRFINVENRLDNVEEVLKATRQDVLKIGDRFVPRYEFDKLLSRVSRIEQRLEGKHK